MRIDHLVPLALLGGSQLLVGDLSAQPEARIYGAKRAQTSTFEVYFSFSDPVAGLTADALQVTNGMAVSINDQGKYPGKYYSAVINAASPGPVSISLPAGAVQENGGGNQMNTASNQFSIVAEYDPAVATWKVDSHEEWIADGHLSQGLQFEDGEARLSGDEGTYSSAIKTFPEPVKPQRVIFRQAPAWDNWTTESTDSHPGNAVNAGIFLPVAKGDYYFFAYGPGGQYYAYHSTDMQSWTQYKRVHGTPNLDEPNQHLVEGKWMTSAEYKDGKFYIIGDVPNDQDPHLWVDDNLNDDIPAVYSGSPVFNDPSDGSDAAIIRTDEDDLFHIIYEDWSMIDANRRSFDSPLGGHTSSPDAMTGFLPHEHAPVVDHRTTATGRTGSYTHPAYPDNPLVYEIYEPEQPAYGDWTGIKLGSKYYLFADYDEHAGGEMTTAIFAGDSIYKQFELVGNVGVGHPDPTIGFAEGKFWLFTQPQSFSSPGPWVETVEARAGVDTDGDNTIDSWTEWQVVTETYDHKPGYARVVDTDPAALDLSALPEGTGFQFEFRANDQTANASTPDMDSVEMSFIGDVPSPPGTGGAGSGGASAGGTASEGGSAPGAGGTAGLGGAAPGTAGGVPSGGSIVGGSAAAGGQATTGGGSGTSPVDANVDQDSGCACASVRPTAGSSRFAWLSLGFVALALPVLRRRRSRRSRPLS